MESSPWRPARALAALRGAFDRELICLWDDADEARGGGRRPVPPGFAPARRYRGSPGSRRRLPRSAARRPAPDAHRSVWDWRADPDVCCVAQTVEVLGGGPVPACWTASGSPSKDHCGSSSCRRPSWRSRRATGFRPTAAPDAQPLHAGSRTPPSRRVSSRSSPPRPGNTPQRRLQSMTVTETSFPVCVVVRPPAPEEADRRVVKLSASGTL